MFQSENSSASFTASNQIGEAMKRGANRKPAKKDEFKPSDDYNQLKQGGELEDPNEPQ